MSLALVHGAVAAALPVARVHLIGGGDGQSGLEKRLHDLLDEEVAALTVDSSPSFRGDEPLRMDAETGAPAVWLILEGTRARVRAAGAGRTRFVFRDLEVGQPLSEFDRERLGQSVKAALTTLVSGDPGALSRSDAAAASGITEPTPAPVSVTTIASPPPPTPELRFRLGAFYQVESAGSGMFHGPGLIATVTDRGRARDPELWLAAGYDVPGEFGNQLASLTLSTLWLRTGLSLRLNDAVRLGLGAGFDRQTRRLVYIVGGSPALPSRDDRINGVGRLLVRAGPTHLAGVDVSFTAFLDVSRSSQVEIYVSPTTNSEILETLYQSNVVEPGFSLDLWWP